MAKLGDELNVDDDTFLMLVAMGRVGWDDNLQMKCGGLRCYQQYARLRDANRCHSNYVGAKLDLVLLGSKAAANMRNKVGF